MLQPSPALHLWRELAEGVPGAVGGHGAAGGAEICIGLGWGGAAEAACLDGATCERGAGSDQQWLSRIGAAGAGC